jgi:signal peptidase I
VTIRCHPVSKEATLNMISQRPWKITITLSVLCGLLFLSIKLNLRLFFVPTGSMESLIPAGSVILSRKTDSESLSIGKVLVFVDQNTKYITAHRLVEISNGQYTTKGDRNSYADPHPVILQDILGQVIAVVPIVNALSVVLQLLFLVVILLTGATMKIFLVCLIRYANTYSSSTRHALCGVCFLRCAKKAFSSWQKSSGSG